MNKKLFIIAIFCVLVAGYSFEASAKSSAKRYPYIQHERLVPLALRELYEAENLYQETKGNGEFSTFLTLIQDGYLNSSWQSNVYQKYGYIFSMYSTVSVGSIPAKITIYAIPYRYRKTGRKSFLIDERGVMRAADRNRAQATVDDPIIETLPYTPLTTRTDSRTISMMRAIHSAQATYQATVGNGDYGAFNALVVANLLPFRSAMFGGYNYQISVTASTNGSPSTYRATATPRSYNVTGIRSFYIDQTGELRGADRNGAAATVNEPIIDTDCVPFEECAISSLRTLYGAQETYAATIGNGNYAGFPALYNANLIPGVLQNGSRAGYSFQVTFNNSATPRTFTIQAVPNVYGGSTRRSFFMDETGVLRGADKNGAYATVDDPPIE